MDRHVSYFASNYHINKYHKKQRKQKKKVVMLVTHNELSDALIFKPTRESPSKTTIYAH